MPRVSEIFGGSYLKVDHLNGEPRVLTVKSWGTEIAFGEEAYVIYFVEEARALKLSPTCARDVAAALRSDEMDKWVGGQIELYPCEQKITDRSTQNEKLVNMIRARAPAPF